jgi:hypothetical protein
MSKYTFAYLWMPILLALSLVNDVLAEPKVHHTIKNDAASRPLRQIAFIPVDIDVYELTVGGVLEEVPEWSRKAEENIRSAVLFTKQDDSDYYAQEQVDSSALTEQERDILEEHLVLFKLVANNALWVTESNVPAWEFKKEHFDYTLGEGLSFLKTKYDVDAGLLIFGRDVISSNERKAAAIVGAVFGVGMALGHTRLIAGLVHFETGEVLWLNRRISTGAVDMRDPESCRSFVKELVKDYPGFNVNESQTP